VFRSLYFGNDIKITALISSITGATITNFVSPAAIATYTGLSG
jgi:hypothetical protein